MKKENLVKQWYKEEKQANIHGWDFSHIQYRYEEEKDLPWDYQNIVKSYINKDDEILDLDTGGGEFLLSLHHPYSKTSATEAYPPNVALCKKILLPLGIHFKEADLKEALPFDDNQFDIVINRHGSINEKEIYRILKPNGIFITEQVGAENDRGLVELLYKNPSKPPYPEEYVAIAKEKFKNAGFSILHAQEAFCPIYFYDVGTLVWFAKVLPWEFPNFSVKNNLKGLYKAQKQLERKGFVEAQIHRYLLIAKKQE